MTTPSHRQPGNDTAIYEMRVTFTNRATPLACQIEENEHQRLLSFAQQTDRTHKFYGINLPRGHSCLLNTRHITRINLLEPLPGIRFIKEPETSQTAGEADIVAREKSDTPVILRLWLRGEEHPVIHHEISYAEAFSIDFSLEEDPTRLLAFEDEDGEYVL